MTDEQSVGQPNGHLGASLPFVPCGSRLDAPWLCVYTKPQAETEADWHLRNQRFPTYLPLHIDATDRQRQIQPLFRRYLFAQPFAGSWSAILGTRGVAGVLRKPDGSARAVPAAALDRLWRQCAPNGVIYPPAPVTIAAGDALRATTGPFAELTGICTRTRKDRIWILLRIMGADREIVFRREQLEPA